jgi:hypothetical protein
MKNRISPTGLAPLIRDSNGRIKMIKFDILT